MPIVVATAMRSWARTVAARRTGNPSIAPARVIPPAAMTARREKVILCFSLAGACGAGSVWNHEEALQLRLCANNQSGCSGTLSAAHISGEYTDF